MTTDAATERAARLAALRTARGQPPAGEANGDGSTAEPAYDPVSTPPATSRGPCGVAADRPRRRSAAAASRVAITGACVTAFLLGIRAMAAPVPAATSPTPSAPASTQPDGEGPATSATAPPRVQPAPVIVVQVVPRPAVPDPGSTPASDPPPTVVTVPPPTSAPVVADELPAPPPPELPACEGSTCG